ncbi:hypothetical protein D3H55_16960 [Bacillus salacetis]|uniref:Uncharacterized protein n=1 Tax=Bacillus salacetis TaxID=2315464 RepID=A0A3A1QSP9_9BACI|nr:hypothetical protein [Bacillus salacetis]RIW30424.1 hypothetical protein D3H55_16960 [Bacillus salacetis]
MDEQQDQEVQQIKKKAKWGCLVWIAILIGIPAVYVLYHAVQFSYDMFLEENQLSISRSPANTNTIEVVETGDAFLLGASSVRIKYGSSHIDTSIANDGKPLSSSNVSINWKDEQTAAVTLYGDEQEAEIIDIQFD